MEDIVKVFRILEYSGPRKWVEECIAKRSVKGIYVLSENKSISEGIIGEYPEIFKKGENKHEEKVY